MKLRPQEELDKIVGTGTVKKERQLELIAHARSAEGRGQLEELSRIFNQKTEDGGLNAKETEFFNKIVDASAPTIVAPTPEQTATVNAAKA